MLMEKTGTGSIANQYSLWQILPRQTTLHRYARCDKISLQRPLDVSLQETNR